MFTQATHILMTEVGREKECIILCYVFMSQWNVVARKFTCLAASFSALFHCRSIPPSFQEECRQYKDLNLEFVSKNSFCYTLTAKIDLYLLGELSKDGQVSIK